MKLKLSHLSTKLKLKLKMRLATPKIVSKTSLHTHARNKQKYDFSSAREFTVCSPDSVHKNSCGISLLSYSNFINI